MSDDRDDGRALVVGASLAGLATAELVAWGDALDRRVRDGTATLDDYGALARTRVELARRAALARSARLRGGTERL